MVHFFEEVWRFKELGILWAICFALIIVGLKVVPQYIKNRSLLMFFIAFVLALVILISYLILNSRKKPEKVVPGDYDYPVDSTISIIVDTTSLPIEVDSNWLSQDFVVGSWDVTWDNTKMKEVIRFDYGNSDKITIESGCGESRIVFCNHPKNVPYYKIVSRNEFKQEAILQLKRMGSKMKGILTISDYDVYFLKANKTEKYHLTFTKK